MIPAIERLINGFLYDAAKGPRWFAMGLVVVGKFLDKGGVIPVTNQPIPLGPLAPYAGPVGTLLVLAGIALATALGTPIPAAVAAEKKQP